jgi:hypothetical protein
MLVEPVQSLPGAAELQDSIEDQADGLLHAAVRVLLIAVAGLHEAHGRADDEFAAARLLITGRKRTLPQQIKLVLVETALQSEQQSIIALTGCIDRLLISQNGVDHARRKCCSDNRSHLGEHVLLLLHAGGNARAD